MCAVRRLLLFALVACKVKDPPAITAKLTDNFERDAIGDNYFPTGEGAQVIKGMLSTHGLHNHPLWLRAKLPHNVKIEFDCWSTETGGDIKIEVFGDGRNFEPPGGGAYTASGYEVIFGGWHNAKSIIAKGNEHGKDVVERTLPKVVPNQHYHWRIERRGRQLTWWIDADPQPFLQYDDATPLEGANHEYFAFNNWETDTWFDNLVITPL
jgi:hypothetical protein